MLTTLRFQLLFMLAALLLLSTACGISEEHQKALDDLAASQKQNRDLNAQLMKTQQDLTAMTGERDTLNNQLGGLQQDKAGLQDRINQAVAELKRREALAEERLNDYRALVGRFKALEQSGKLKVTFRKGRMVLDLASDILFESGRAKVSKDGQEALAEVVQILITIPDKKFQIEGHTDNKPIKRRFDSNWHLGSARALNVLNVMIEAGLPKERISLASFGEVMPAFDNNTDNGRAKNRRIEIVVVPDLEQLPGFKELREEAERTTGS